MTRKFKRRITFLLALIVVLVAGVVIVKLVRDSQSARMLAESREAGMQAYAENDYPAAIENLSNYNAHIQTDYETLIAFGHARAMVPAEGYISQAIYLTQQGLLVMEAEAETEIDSDLYEQAQRRILEWYEMAQQFVEVSELADRLLAKHPNDVRLISAKAVSLRNQRLLEEAGPFISRLIELEPETISWYALKIDVLLTLDTPELEMLEMTQQWIDEYEGDGRFHVLRAGLLIKFNDYVGAREEMELGEAQGYRDTDVLSRSVLVYDQLGNFNKADEALQEAIEVEPNNQGVYEVTVRRLWRSSRLEEAKKTLALAEERFENLSQELMRDKLLLSLLSADSSSAKVIAEEMILQFQGQEKQAQEAWANAMLARSLLNETNIQEVLDQVLDASVINSKDPVIHYILGELYSYRGQNPEALDSFGKARKLDHRWLAANVAYARTLVTAGRPREALPVARDSMFISPKGMVAPFLLYSDVFLLVEEANKKIGPVNSPQELIFVTENLEELASLIVDSELVAPLLVRAYLLADDSAAAIGVMEATLEDSNSTYPTFIKLAALSERTGLGLDKRLMAEARRRGTPSNFNVLLAANKMAVDGNVEGGLEMIDAAIEKLQPNSPELRNWRRLRVTYLIQQGHEKAGDALSQLVVVYPSDLSIQKMALQTQQFEDLPELAQVVIANLRRELGDESQLVTLAMASALMADSELDEKSLAEATVRIQDILEVDPDSELALELLVRANLSGTVPSYSSAIRALTSLNSLYPDNADRLIRLIGLQQVTGDYDSAASNLSQLSPMVDAEPRLNKSELRLLSKQGDVKLLSKRIQKMDAPNASFSDRMLMAELLTNIGESRRAGEIYESLLESEPNDNVRIAYANYLGLQGQIEEGRVVLSQVPDDGVSARMPMTRGLYAARFLGPDAADPFFDIGIARSPENPLLYYDAAKLLMKSGSPERALKKVQAGLEIAPEDSGLLESLALILLEMGGDTNDVLAKLSVRETSSDTLFVALSLLEKIPLEDGKRNPSNVDLAEVMRIIKKSPQHSVLWIMAISIHEDGGKYSRAWDLAQQAANRFPNNSLPLQRAAEISAKQKKWDQAIADTQAWRERTPYATLKPDLFLARCYLENDQPRKAISILENYKDELASTVEERPFDTSLLVTALAEVGDFEDARAIVQDLLPSDDKWVQLWLGVSQLFEPSETAEAIEMVESLSSDAVGIKGEVMRAWVRLSERDQNPIYLQKAIASATQMTEIPSEATRGELVLAQIATGQNNLSKALVIYQGVLEREPKNTVALNNMAMVFINNGQPDEALVAINRALDENPDWLVLLDTKGQSLCAQGQYEESFEVFSKIIAVDPEYLSSRLHYVSCLIESGRLSEAESILGKAQLSTVDREEMESEQKALLESIESKLHSMSTGVNW
ncbi:MAG: tetratricopeptide repeat protein [Phycisphaerales bacterium]|nr:tetratricopeptide repeat protein [Phycisphaerales bacterium]